MEDQEKKECCCNKILCVTMVTNTVTSLALAVIAVILVCRMFMPPVMARPFNKQPVAPNAQQEQQAPAQKEEGLLDKVFNKQDPNHVFSKKTMTLADAKKNKNKNIVVLFYADWCPHCRNFGPTFTKLSKDRELRRKFNFVAINSESPAARELMQEFKVEGFPALFLYNNQTDEKKFIENQLLFGDNAVEFLKETFLNF